MTTEVQIAEGASQVSSGFSWLIRVELTRSVSVATLADMLTSGSWPKFVGYRVELTRVVVGIETLFLSVLAGSLLLPPEAGQVFDTTRA